MSSSSSEFIELWMQIDRRVYCRRQEDGSVCEMSVHWGTKEWTTQFWLCKQGQSRWVPLNFCSESRRNFDLVVSLLCRDFFVFGEL